MLVLIGVLPIWHSVRSYEAARAMIRGVNAALVGLLGSATLYDPVWVTTVHEPGDVGVALIGFVLLTVWRAPPLLVVGLSAAAGIMGG